MATYYFLEYPGVGFKDPEFSRPNVTLPYGVETDLKIDITLEMRVSGIIGVSPVKLQQVKINNLDYDSASLFERIVEHLDQYHTKPL
jgi:hypothetical protein